MIQDALTAAIPHLAAADLTTDLVANIQAGAWREAADRFEGPLTDSEFRSAQWRAGRLTAVGVRYVAWQTTRTQPRAARDGSGHSWMSHGTNSRNRQRTPNRIAM